MVVAGEDAKQDRLAARRHFCQLVGCLVESSRDVVELEAIELILQLSNPLAVRGHLGVEAAQLFHDLVDDRSRVTSNVKSLNAQLNGDAQAVDECLVPSHVI
jgi:hypothetical protein